MSDSTICAIIAVVWAAGLAFVHFHYRAKKRKFSSVGEKAIAIEQAINDVIGGRTCPSGFVAAVELKGLKEDLYEKFGGIKVKIFWDSESCSYVVNVKIKGWGGEINVPYPIRKPS